MSTDTAKKVYTRKKRVLTDKEREDQFISAEVYAALSTEAGHKITATGIRSRINNGIMSITEIDNIEGVFIDKHAYPFGSLPRGPKSTTVRKPKKIVKKIAVKKKRTRKKKNDLPIV